MKWGTFIAIDRKKHLVKGANQVQMVMEEYMHLQGIEDSKDIVGPFETVIQDREDGSYERMTEEQLHQEALKLARVEQQRAAAKLRRSAETGPMGIVEYAAKESGFPIGSKKLKDYINRHYGHN